MNKENKLSPVTRSERVKVAASFMWAFAGTLLITSSVVQASDMQIYAVPTAGKKTIVMMLDTSGSMAFSDSGQTGTRLARLKAGMNAFLDSNNSTLPNVKVGLGHYSVSGDGKAGRILVPAEPLGNVGSAQRVALKTAVNGLSAEGGTPTAAAYAEAAAYLMGTTTLSSNTASIPMYIRYYPNVVQTSGKTYKACSSNTTSGSTNSSNCTYTLSTTPSASTLSNYDDTTSSSTSGNVKTYITYYYKRRGSTTTYYYTATYTEATVPGTTFNYQSCTAYDTNGCTAWGSVSTTNPTTSAYTTCTVSGVTGGGCVYEDKTILGTNSYSGFNSSVRTSKDPDTDYTSYKSPLPATADRVTCDGQGVYILSDGAANGFGSTSVPSVMAAALETSNGVFSCSGGLADANDPDGNAGGWNCMGEFAKKLFNKTTNPAGVSIQTAFVGFGNDMNSLTNGFVKRACGLSSRTQSDRSGDDACSPNQTTNAIASPGYGNGGFFTAQSSQGVTESVIAFINNIGGVPLNPLTTGAISVPIDPLTSNGFQPFGYLRALEPNPANAKLVWLGNLKKYKVLLEGANAGAFADKNSNIVYNSKGGFESATKDIWNSSAYNDGGIIKLGGAYSKIPMPALGQTEDLTATPPKYTVASTPNAIRTLFTDVASTGGAALSAMANSNSLLRIPEGPLPTSNISSYVLGKLNASTGQTTLKDFPLLAKQKILNYLGYSVPLDSTATGLPSSLVTPDTPSFAMGGSVHSFPVQLTYSGTLDANGDLTATRDQSVLYGSMEGGLHIVNGDTGVEQMVFVPSEILRDSVASKALVKGEEDLLSPTAGVDGAWVADPAYKVSSNGSSIEARQMNVYGGLRMGGNSYYGLDVLNPSSPKLLFRAGADQSDFSRMGQSWSKPVLANIRYNGAIKRVMIVGGGYDTCYESPSATLTTGSCGTEAKGNAVYIIDAKTGARLWWASSSGSNTNNANMKHSIVSRISVLDRNADGLIDHLYFGDLGGQVFRADLNNNQTKAGSSYSSFGVRVVRLANLATTSAGVALTDGKNPRFYEAPTVTIHDQGGATFIMVGIASGNRSTPLDVFPIQGRTGMSPAVALDDRLVNNVYGIIDRDFINRDLMTIADSTLVTKDKNLSTFQKDPQKITSGNVVSTFFPSSGLGKDGWYRSLSSKSDGTERADNSFRIKGGLKAFEEPIALTGNLIVPVYDPQGTGVAPSDSCQPRVVGETDRQLYCLPFGVCLNSNGTTNTVEELKTGFLTTTETAKCPPGVAECNDNTLGSGIRGVSLAPIKDDPTKGDSCGKLTLAGNITGAGEWQCTRKLNPTRWYEKYASS